jgi:hypothetical protein
MACIVKRFWHPFFPSVLLGELLPQDLDRFLEYLTPLSLRNSRKNDIIKTGAVPLRWAFRKEKISQDVTRGITIFSVKPAERRILPLETASAIFRLGWNDERARAANMTQPWSPGFVPVSSRGCGRGTWGRII